MLVIFFVPTLDISYINKCIFIAEILVHSRYYIFAYIFYSCNLQKVCILLSQYLSVCRHDFTCFSCGREFHLPGTTVTKPRTKINKERARQKPDLTIGNKSKEAPKLSLIPSRKTKSAIQKDPTPSKIIDDPLIEIDHVGHETTDNDGNLIDNLNDCAETIATKTNINNNESDLPATKIENIDRSVKKSVIVHNEY